MPCYLFSFHAFASWMPDRKRGYTKRKKGYLPQDKDMARRYRENMKEDRASFDEEIQRALIEESIIACKHQKMRLHHIGSDESHLHDLVSWKDGRNWSRLRASLRSSLTRRLNTQFGKRTWFSESASRKRVRNQPHFNCLDEEYLPDHPGLKYSENRGIYQ
jgi:hypothetical protein